MTHIGDCSIAKVVGDEIAKDRLCVDCPRAPDGGGGSGGAENDAAGPAKGKGQSKGKGKGKGKDTPTGRGTPRSNRNLLPAASGDEAADMDKCM